MSPTLRFVPYREIAHEVAARLAASRAACDPLAPWSEDVLVPSRGVAEAIVAALVEKLPQGIAGLQIRSLEKFAESLVVARVADDAERRLAMRVAARSLDDPMLEGRGVASMLERSYRDVRDSGLTLATFTKRVASTRALRNARRTETIVRVWNEYERLITQLGAIDPANLLARAASAIKPDTRPQLLAGFYDMTGAQLAIVDALRNAARLAAVWIPTEAAFAQPLIEAMTRDAEVVRDPLLEIRAPQVTATQYATRDEELRSVCAEMSGLLRDGVPAREIGIVARSLEPWDVRLLNRFAGEEGFRTTLTDAVPLVAHRIGRGAVTLLRLRERGFPRSEVLELVRDGLRTRTHIRIDEADAATRRERIAGGTAAELAPFRDRKFVIDDYISLVEELETLTSSLDVELLERLGSAFRIETDLDLAAAEELDAIAALFRETQTWTRGLDVAAVIDAIENASLEIRNGDDRPRVWAGDVMRFRGRSFRHVFAVRMQDDVFPQRRNEDPLLPDSDRKTLGLREIGDGTAEEQLLFSLIEQESANVHYSAASTDGFGKTFRRSRYIRAAQFSSPPSHALEHESRAVSLRQLQLLAKAGTSSPFDGYVTTLEEHIRTRLRSVSPTQLEDFGECPQKFLLKHLLGVEDFDDPERELQIHHREKGTIDHRILERFYRSLTPEQMQLAAASLPQLPEDLVERLESIIDGEFEALEGKTPAFNPTVRALEHQATKRILRDFVIADLADLEAQDLMPQHFEYRFGQKHREAANHPEPFVVDAGGVPIRVEGTIDRIDVGGERYRIVDYKSGKAGRHVNLADKIDRGVRLQLALYAMAVAEFFGTDPQNVSGTIKPIVAGEKLAKFGFTLHEKRDALLETLDIFVRAILSGSFPAFPDDEIGSCKYCPVNHSCRTRHDPEERYAVQQLGDPRTLLGGSR